jgi:cytochrome oxidase Cu insertion factor (SCO1/SenC/PrrC family)
VGHGDARYAGSRLLGTVLCLAVAVAALSGCDLRRASGETTSPAPRVGTTLDGPVPASVLDAPLVDSRGHATTLRGLRGKVIVLSDVMTLCQESCPIITASMVAAARDLDRTSLGRRVEFVSLTIDPTRDDERHLRAYRRQFPALPNWTVLTGSPAVVDAVWRTLGVWRHTTRLRPPLPRDWVTGVPLTTDIAHTDELIFIDGSQRFRYELDGYGDVPPSSIPPHLYRFMDALGHRNVEQPDPGSWTPAQVSDVLRWVLGSSS